MATDAGFLQYVLDQAALGERLSARRMFGEYALYVDGKVVGFCADNRLLLKCVEQTRDLLCALPQQELFPGSKLHALADEWLDDAEHLRSQLLQLAQRLPAPRPRQPKGTPPRRPSARTR